MWVIVIAVVLVFLYASVIVRTAMLVPGEVSEAMYQKANVSVIVPCRNEANNIASCIHAIASQTVFTEHVELIIVDDHSEDDTKSIVENAGRSVPLRLIESNGFGKKAALLTGLRQASHNIICTIDADCITPVRHLEIMTGEFLKAKLKMLCGPVNFKAEGLFEKLQQAESAAVVGISAVFLNAGKPATCNGANLMFEKKAFFDAGGYNGHTTLASGDDDLLMQSMYGKFQAGVKYCMHQGTVVETAAVKGLGNLLNQRGRWITKSAFYIFPWNKYLQLLVSVHLISFFLLLLYGVLSLQLYLLIPVAVKYTADFVLGVRLKKVLKLNLFMIFLMPFYQLYIFLLPLSSLVYKTDWKGRRLISSKNS